MIVPLPTRKLGAICLGIFLAIALNGTAPGATAKKKHHVAGAGASSVTKHKSAHAAGTKGSLGKARTRARYAPVAHLDATRKAALIEKISDDLQRPDSQPIAFTAALDGFYAQLESHETAHRDTTASAGTLRVLQFGDSHTAADMFTGEARRVFQERFGNGGIGYSYAGHPFAGYRILGSSRSQTSGWKTQGNKFLQLGTAQTGLGGISITTEQAGEQVTLDTSCTTLELQYLQQPGGGNMRFADNGSAPVEIETDASTIGAGTFTYYCPAGDHHFELTTEQNAPVTLLGWVATQPGVTWESIGINGAEAPLILKWDQGLFSQYLKANSPALIVLAYGTNEAASSYWDEDTYRQTFASLIDTIHFYVPESSILVVGPADRSVAQHRAWHAFAGTDHIIRAQRAVCRAHGCAFWDQRQRMGGFGAMQQWVNIGWAQPDHTHFTGTGYKALADALITDLISGYSAYKERNPLAAQGATDGTTGSNP
jgi:lysophospholipase L1-like esterase